VPFYETVFETGRVSVACYEDDAEAKAAVGEHDRRARAGEVGGPVGQPAERIAAVYVYDEHPNEFNVDQTMSADVLKKELYALVDSAKDTNGVVSVDQFVGKVRGLTHPMVDSLDKPFESRYKMEQTKRLDLGFLEGGK
jgi:hypothetical protein